MAKMKKEDLPEVANIVWDYCKKIKSGEIPSCKYTKKSVQRFMNDVKQMENESFDFVMDWRPVQNLYDFAKTLKIPHVEGSFCFLPWQLFIVANLYGWRYKTDLTKKRFREGCVIVPRKNGKTLVEQVLCIWDLLTTPEAGVYIFSADLNMVENTYADILKSLKEIPEIADKINPKTFVTTYKDSRLAYLSPESCADSYNVSLSICDETHAWSSFKAIQAMKYGSRARKNALVLQITTAGDNVSSPLYDYQTNKMFKVLDGIYEDPYSFYAFWGADDEDEWDSEAALIKANPSLDCNGGYMDKKILLQDLEDAKNLTSRKPEYIAKTLDRWTEGTSAWIKVEDWNKANIKADIEDYKDNIFYAGLDLAMINDWAALTFMTFDKEQNKYVSFHHFYIPAGLVEEKCKTDIASIRDWIEQGYITPTPGFTIDYDYIKEEILDFAKEYKLKEIAYDPWHSNELITQLEEELSNDIILVAVSQSMKSISPTARSWEKDVIDGNIVDSCPVMRWMVNNTYVNPDINGNIKPMKKTKSSTQKIDGVISTMLAYSRCVANKSGDAESEFGFDDFMSLL